jgi:hypothetical protein
VCGVHYDKRKRGCGGFDEENRERRGTRWLSGLFDGRQRREKERGNKIILINSFLQEPDKKIYHLCIVNLVIGTLYCAKGNFEFGISRIIKSLEPYQKKVCIST